MLGAGTTLRGSFMNRYSHGLVLVAVAFGPAALAQETKEEILTKSFEDRRDLTLLKRVTERTFVHEIARVSFTVPTGWKEIPPHRLARRIDTRISTVLGVERDDRDLVASIYWMPMNPGAKLTEWVRDTAFAGEYGEEYETLKAVYGKNQVTTPLKIRQGTFEVYRINITGGPDRGDRYDGALFVFESESGGRNWLIRARVSYPKSDRTRADEYAMEVLGGFSQVGPRPCDAGLWMVGAELDALFQAEKK
jgi:hypothetical protein